MAEILGMKKLQAIFQAKVARVPAKNVTAVVGYTDKVALFVHENLGMKLKGLPRASGIGVYWGPSGRSKFLEAPFRENSPLMTQMIKDDIANGKTVEQAMLRAGLFLQRISMQNVPVEYGTLRASAFTRLEEML